MVKWDKAYKTPGTEQTFAAVTLTQPYGEGDEQAVTQIVTDHFLGS